MGAGMETSNQAATPTQPAVLLSRARSAVKFLCGAQAGHEALSNSYAESSVSTGYASVAKVPGRAKFNLQKLIRFITQRGTLSASEIIKSGLAAMPLMDVDQEFIAGGEEGTVGALNAIKAFIGERWRVKSIIVTVTKF
ncbi:unnamed protein product [Calypogeia fissa]